MKFSLIFIITAIVVFKLNAQEVGVPKIDQRALNVYTSKEIAEMPAYKIEQINFLFNKSFLIPNDMKDKVKPEDINGIEYNVFRKENERVKVPVLLNKEEKSEEYIVLLSYKELDQAYLRIKNKYN